MRVAGPPLPPPAPLGALLRRGLAEGPGKPAIVTKDGSLSYADLDRLSARLAAAYLARGLSPGDRVASLMPNGFPLVLHYFACMRAGLVATPLNYRYTPREIDHALAVSGAAMLLHHAEREGDAAASKRVPDLAAGVLRACGDGAAPDAFEAALAAEAGSPPAAPGDEDAPAFILFTSGSTGPAKGVTHSRRSLATIARNVASALALGPDDRLLTTTSHSHIGATSLLLGTLLEGGTVIVALSSDPGEVLDLVRRERPTVTVSLPQTVMALVSDGGAEAEDFASFRHVATSGDRASETLLDRFEALAGRPLAQLYGMTEGTILMLAPPGEPAMRGTVGRPAHGVEAEIRDEDGRPLPPGEPGRLFVRYAGATTGYWGRPEATAEVLADGWLDTGDVMARDADGVFRFEGRRKQIIVHDGSNIAPQEVEEALLAHPAIAGAGAVGVHDEVHGENVWAYVRLAPGAARPRVADLLAFARERIGYKAPEVVVFLDDMPLTPVGKVDRTALKARAAREAEAGGEAASAHAPEGP